MIYIDTKADIVIIKLATQKEAVNADITENTMLAIDAIIEHLANGDVQE